jgi:drug/metabolite transporter (DMT)-like permease
MKMEWFITAFISMLAFSVAFLLFRIISDLKVKSELAFLYYFAISALFLFFYLYFNKMSLSVNKIQFLFIFVAAIFGVIGNVLLYNSLGSSPNPGYTLAVVGVNALVVTVASVFIFKSDFSLIKLAGAVCVVVGVSLLGLK